MPADMFNYLDIKKPDAYNPYAAGQKLYGSGRMNPTSGALLNTEGYAQRDMEARARMNAIKSRMRSQQNPSDFKSNEFFRRV